MSLHREIERRAAEMQFASNNVPENFADGEQSHE
jgi:hypothetical protein